MPTLTTLERRLDVREVAELLRVTEKTVYRWANAGQIPCIRHGRTLRFLLSDLEKADRRVTTGKI